MKLRSKKRLISLHLIALCILGLLVVTFCEEIQEVKNSIATALLAEDPPVPPQWSDIRKTSTTGGEWFADAPLIYHAGGSIEGGTYTNSREAVESTLAAGSRFIEIDIDYTSDGHLVCVHSWSDIYPDWKPLTLEAFQNLKIQGKFTPMTGQDLLEMMREHPQMYLVTDTKCDLSQAISDLVALAGSDASLLDRFIIQVYQEGQKASIQQIYPFADEQFLFTLYTWGPWCLEAAKICSDENISVITMPYDSIPAEDAARMDQLGYTIYEHTVNRLDTARAALDRGVHGLYTDSLQPGDLLAP